jgi:mono/diheme cytochrome c family protein
LCHVKQFQEWSSSLHARAAGGGLLGQLPAFDLETQTACLRCHAPRSEQQEAFLAAAPGEVQSLTGVDCVACHVRRHRRYGAAFKPLTPHGEVTGLPLFDDGVFCSPCHQFPDWGERVNGKLLESTEQEWRASPYAREGVSCQDCHMRGGGHEFKGIHDPEMTRTALQVEVWRTRNGVEIRAGNVGAGHALPTYATPRIRVLLQQGIADGERRVHNIQRKLHWDPSSGWTEQSDTRLLPGQTIRVALDLEPDQGAEAILFVEPDALYHELVYPSLEETIGGDLDPSSLQLLREAKQKAGRTGYFLCRSRCPPWQGSETGCAVEWLLSPNGYDRAGSPSLDP